ncbi:hypothetical protein HXX76_003077 [Chlamydomonas incerta]|uniref:THO complex subunit 1 n=1 Tax=Chlamydomonas incerta TaxID=51695 RepID=A0A835TP64_CHLIN|nr:hypothetical protein HXX76_003077 [Chlamydomonas incerta]|eukprot:KAG2441455.1 hypothetical protein HXX76_003077 [Chlamydomonas incerta]
MVKLTVEFNAEKARIEDTILAAINTSLPPAEAARKALAGAFPAATFNFKEDGSLSVQGLDASMRQGLEDALFELNMSLANQAVAQGMPLMQYLHPDAAHDGIRTLPRFLQVCLELARPLLSEPLRESERAGPGRRRLLDYEGWARLFEGLMEVGTIADCTELFCLMEGSSAAAAAAAAAGGSGGGGGGGGGRAPAGAKSAAGAAAGAGARAAGGGLGWAGVFCAEDFRREQGAKLALLRMSNMLFRRLSKAYDVRLCGRLLIFISRCYELNDKSGLNVLGALNTGLALPVDDVAPGATDSIGELVDRRLYGGFWGLQAVFQAPNQVLTPAVYGKVLGDMGAVLDELAGIRGAVAAAGPWAAARQARTAAGDSMDVDGAAAVGEDGGGDAAGGGGAGARYLTSSKLFGLQLRDCTFRRNFLLQCLALLQYIEQPNKADKSGLPGGGRPEGLEAMRARLYAALAETKDHGPEFAEAVKAVLANEAHWVAWKHGTQPPGGLGTAAAAAAAPGAAAGGAAAAGGGGAGASSGGAAPGAAGGGAGAAPAASELCRDFTRPPAPPTREIVSSSHAQEAGAGPGGRRRKGGRAAAAAAASGLAGRYVVSRGVTGLPDPMAGLRVGERRTRARNLLGEEEVVPLLPTPQELLAPVLEDLDPDNDVEPPYRRCREQVFAWKRLRCVARNYLECYKKGDDLEDSVLDLHPALRARIAQVKAAREAELAAAAAAEAEEAAAEAAAAAAAAEVGDAEMGEAGAAGVKEEGEAPSPRAGAKRAAAAEVKLEEGEAA